MDVVLVLRYVPCFPNLSCALQIQLDLRQKLCFKNLIKRIISAQTQHRYRVYTHIRSSLPCLCFAWCCRTVQVHGTWLLPLPVQRVLGCGGRPGGQLCRLTWTYIVFLAGTDQRGIFSVNITVLLWSVAKKEKTGGGPEILLLCFESSSVVAFPLQQPPKGDEMRNVCISQLFSEIILTKVFILASLGDFYFATQCIQSPFSSTPFLFFFFVYLVFCYVNRSYRNYSTRTVQKFCLST